MPSRVTNYTELDEARDKVVVCASEIDKVRANVFGTAREVQ